MRPRVQRAVAAVKEWHHQHGEWPALPTTLSAVLDLTGDDIEEAVESGLLAVLPGKPPRLASPDCDCMDCSIAGEPTH